MFGCSWKIVSGKFQQLNTSKLTFVVDSDDEINNDDDDEDDISVDNDVIAKISQKSSVSDKKTLVEKQPVAVAAAPVASHATLKPVQKVVPQEEEDDDEEDDDDDALENVDEEGEDDEEEEEEDLVKVVEEPVKPVQETKVKKTAATKKK
jgi:hypothetical protein